jgi:hypothetical protein
MALGDEWARDGWWGEEEFREERGKGEWPGKLVRQHQNPRPKRANVDD